MTGLQCLLFLMSIYISNGLQTNKVIPSCNETAKVCEFDWVVSEKFTMVWYNKTQNKGYPVIYENGKFIKRDPNNCTGGTEMTEEEIQEVETADGEYRPAYFINDQTPGPSIVVYEGTQVVVRVKNALLNEGLSFHWHGMFQRNTPWMDGVGGVTQCSIAHQERFTYRFVAHPPGTHWYHGHVGTKRTDGLYGALIVLERKDTENTENDTSIIDNNTKTRINISDDYVPVLPRFESEFIFMVTDWFHNSSQHIMTSYLAELQAFWYGLDNTVQCHAKTQQDDGSEIGTFPFISGLVNGKGHFFPGKNNTNPKKNVPLETFTVIPWKLYRFRIINPSFNFGFRISVDDHDMHVMASDGSRVEATPAESVFVHAGERFDFFIQTDKPIGNYWIRAETIETTNSREFSFDNPGRIEPPGLVLAVLRYNGSDVELPTTERRNCSALPECVVVNCPFQHFKDELSHCVTIDQLKSIESSNLEPIEEDQFQEHFLNFHFPVTDTGILRSSVNGRQFIGPSSPPLITPGTPLLDECDEDECADRHCSCTYKIDAHYGNWVQLVLLSTVTYIPWPGVPASAHPFHLHGHNFYVLKVGFPEYDPVTKIYAEQNPDFNCPTRRCHNATWTNDTWTNGNIPGLNLKNPPMKDTILVPAGGYVVIRFKADNPGWWMLHCHIELHQIEGMALLIKEGEDHMMNTPPRGFPTCGSFDWSTEEFEDKINGIQSSTEGDVSTAFTTVTSQDTDNSTNLNESITTQDTERGDTNSATKYSITTTYLSLSIFLINYLFIFDH